MNDFFRKFNKPAATSFLALLLLASVVTAGSLTPPGAPGSTMNTLAEIYDTIAGAFDSTGVVADQNGSLLEHLKYIEANMGTVGGGWTDDGTVVRLTTITDNVGIGTTTPNNRLQVAGLISFDDAGFSTVLGSQALVFTASSSNNTAVGYGALQVDLNGSYNTAIGAFALNSNTDGSNNSANGQGALQSNTTGSYNVANGYQALALNTTGWFNTANGANALLSNTTGETNTANGAFALTLNTSGTDNTANGASALGNNSIGSNNTANGKYALYNNTTGNNNTANGTGALFISFVGDDNVAVGASAGFSFAGSGGVFIGRSAGYSTTTGANNTAVGFQSLFTNTTGSENTANGYQALFSNDTGYQNTAVGYQSLFTNTTGAFNTANGYQSLFNNTTGDYNTANGHNALLSNTTGIQNTANGANALLSNTTGSFNTANGVDALVNNSTGESNTATGRSALNLNTTGSFNAANGFIALQNNDTGNFNTANGARALNVNLTGNFNTANGWNALLFNMTGSYNTADGTGALTLNITGNDNVAVGASAGYSALGSGNVFLGRNAGYSETGSDRLYIDNSNTANPLIYGEFDNNYLRFNGSASISGHFEPTADNTYDLGSSTFRWRDLYLASGSLHIGTSGDEAVIDYNVTDDYLSFKPDGSTTRMVIKDGGNVGIGTTSPVAQLHVPGSLPSSATGSITLNGTSGFGVFVQGRYAYLNMIGGPGLEIVDISDPSAPASMSTLTLSGLRSVYVQGSYLYTAQGFGAPGNVMRIYDITRPKTPTLVGSLSGFDLKYLVVQGRYAYALDTTSNFRVFDVANPSAPTAVSSVAVGAAVGNVSMYANGNFVYINDGSTGRLRIFNVVNPASPYQIGSVAITGGGGPGVYVQGRYAYVVSTSGSTLQVYDISNPTSPTSVGSVATAAAPEWVQVQGHYAYVSNFTAANVQVFDITVPTTPVSVGTFATNASIYGIWVQGRYLYTSHFASPATMQVFDLGGAYIQQFETGGMETGTLMTRNNAHIGGDMDIRGGLVVARGANITGPFSVTSSASGYTAFTVNPDGSASVSGTLETGGMVINGHLIPGAHDTYDLGSSTVRWRDLYLASGSLHIGVSGDEAVIDYNITDDYLAFKPDGTTTTLRMFDTGNASISGGLEVTSQLQFGEIIGDASISNALFAQNGGNVGIGTTTPAASLEINRPNAEQLRIRNNSSNNNFISFYNGATLKGYLQYISDDAYLVNQANGAMHFYTNAAEQMTILSGGNVGIGATGPTAKLEVAGSIYSSATETDTVFSGSASTNNASFIGPSGYWALRGATDHSYNLDVYNGGSPLTAMTIASTGYVGIGTTEPAAKFDIRSVADSVGKTVYVGPSSASFTALVRDSYMAGSENIFTTLNDDIESIGLLGVGQSNVAGNSANGVYGLAESTNSSGTMSVVYGVQGDAAHSGAGTVTNLWGAVGAATNYGAGTVTNAMSLYTWPVGNFGAGTVANAYGVYISDQAGVGTTNYNLYAEGPSDNYFGGNVGIGATSPSVKLHVASTSDEDIFRLQDSDGDCLFNPETGSLITTCPSDARLKKNVVDSGSALDYLAGFRIRDYTVIKSGERKTGVIAQELIKTHPELVSVGPSGLLGVQEPNAWILLKAIQELDGKIVSLADDGPVQFDEASLFQRFLAYLRDAVLSVKKLTASDKVCIGSTCVDEEQLKALLEDNGVPPTTDSDPEPSDEPNETPESIPEPSVGPEPSPSPEPEMTTVPTPEPEETPEENGSPDEPFEEPASEAEPAQPDTPETP